MRYVCLVVLAFSLLLSLSTSALFGQEGAVLYKQRCAACHDAPQGRVPALGAIKQMSGEVIYGALSSGVMKRQAEGLSVAQIIKIITYIAPTGGVSATPAFGKSCPAGAPFVVDAADGWGGWSPDVTNSRFQSAHAAGLAAADVPKLKLKWAFNLGAVTIGRGQPAVAGNRVFIATQLGDVYALDVETGCVHWGIRVPGGVRSGVAVGDAHGIPAIFFGDASAVMYAVNAATGELLWKTRPVDHMFATSTATPQVYQGVVYQGFSSYEEAVAADPRAVCCTFRGSVVALDAATGKKLWETFTISQAPQPTKPGKNIGPSGAAVWSTPTIDEKLGALYVATGDNYSNPTTETSDAVLALDLKTGTLLWSRQLTKGDAYNVGCVTPARTNCADEDGPDFDFGQPPVLVPLDAKRRALVIGQKSGMVHALDPDQRGQILWQTRAGEGGKFGGSQWGSAADGQKMYVAISDIDVHGAPDANAPGGFRLVLDPKKGGGLHALDLRSGAITWSAKPATCPETQAICSPAQSAAVTAIPGAVFSGAVDGHMRAYSSRDGQLLWDFDTAREFPTVNGSPAHGGSIDASGAAVVGGKVFVTSGYNQWGGMPGNVMLVFSVDGR
jgi:polyvinyl alcohol dehydrogenase (cytochrome)